MTAHGHVPQVLVAAGEPSTRERVEVALTHHGCAVTTAATGNDALRQAGSADHDLIVLDEVLPVLDQADQLAGKPGTAATLHAADLELDATRWTVHKGGTPVELSPTEFRLLTYLMRHQGRVLTRAQLLENVWGWDYAGES